MVVRAVIGVVVNRLPYSDHLPNLVKRMLDDTPQKLDPVTPTNEPVEVLSPRQKIHNRMLDRRNPSVYSDSGISTPTSGTTTLLPGFDSISEECDTEDSVVQKYLDEQNAKFDSLINQNMSIVLLQQNKFEDDAPWQQLVFDLMTSKDNEDVAPKLNVLVGKASSYLYSYVPFHKEPKITEVTQAARTIPDEFPVDNFLDSLDYNTKVRLMKQLRVDLGLTENDDLSKLSIELERHLKSAPSLMIDKLELLMVVSVRLAFLGMKFLIPISTLLYLKFKNNEVLLFNSKNFNRLLSFVIGFMERLEESLHSDKLQTFQYGKLQEKELPGEYSEDRETSKGEALNDELRRYIDEWGEDNNTEKQTSSWTRSLTRMAIGKFFGSYEVQDYTADPRYSHYFSGKSQLPLEYNEDSSDSSDSREQLSVFRIAQQFADEMS